MNRCDGECSCNYTSPRWVSSNKAAKAAAFQYNKSSAPLWHCLIRKQDNNVASFIFDLNHVVHQTIAIGFEVLQKY